MFSLPLVKPKPADSDDEISVAHFTPPEMGKSMVKGHQTGKNDDNSETVPTSGSKKMRWLRSEISDTKK